VEKARTPSHKPKNNADHKQAERWNKVLLLGKDFLSITHQCDLSQEQSLFSSLDKFIQTTKQVAEQVLQANALLWFSKDYLLPNKLSLGKDFIDNSTEIYFFTANHPPQVKSPDPLSNLIGKTFTTLKTSYAYQEKIPKSNSTKWKTKLGKPDQSRIQFLVLPITITKPFLDEEKLIGILALQAKSKSGFNTSDCLLSEAIANQLMQGLIRLREKFTENHRNEQYTTLLEVSNIISSVLDKEKLLEQVVELIQKRFNYPYIHLFSVHPGRRRIFYEAGTGARSKMMHQTRFSIDLDDPSGIIPWVGRNGVTVLCNDVTQDPRYRPEPFPPEKTLSELTVPLIFGDKILGILDVQSDQLNAFTEQDRFLIEALADMIAVAMRNAALYRSERWRRQVADSLREVAGLLSANVSVEQVLQTILVELDRNLPNDLATIWLLEDDEDENSCRDGTEEMRLKLAAIYGVGEPLTDLRIGMYLDEVNQSNLASSDIQKALSPSWFKTALESEKPLIYNPTRNEGEQTPSRDISAIAARLRVGSQNLGVLTLFHHTSGRYGSEAQAMTEAFASYAAVAIENARLYEAAHEQAWISTVMLQVAEATRTITNLKDLLETVARITPTVAGVRTCMLYLIDEDQVFIPAVASGLHSVQLNEFKRTTFTTEEVPALKRLMEDKSPVILDDENEDCRMSEVLFVGLETDNLLVDELYILVPLVSREEILGAMLISYTIDLFEQNKQQTIKKFFNRTLPILQGIAHQTAISIENTRLIRAQKEEAYVSVALLQVAQIIVSSYNLDDVLGSIVRTTPLLWS